jgi:hypothetical protein
VKADSVLDSPPLIDGPGLMSEVLKLNRGFGADLYLIMSRGFSRWAKRQTRSYQAD